MGTQCRIENKNQFVGAAKMLLVNKADKLSPV